MRLIIQVIFALFFGQISFGMNESEALFPRFTALDKEIQNEVMKYEEHKANLQLVNKYWAIKASIKSPDVFHHNFCNNNKHRLQRVLLNAAYCKNYEGVKNILENSYILIDKKQTSFFNYCDTTYNLNDAIYDKKGCILGLADIMQHNKNTEQFVLLKKYNIPTNVTNSRHDIDLIMACLAGNSDLINCSHDDKRELYLTIAVDCDHGKCIKKLLDPLFCDTGIIESLTWKSNEYLVLLLNKDIFVRAIYKKKLKALDALLSFNVFNINRWFIESDIKALITQNPKGYYCVVFRTLLEHVVRNNRDNQYDDVIEILKKYHAKTTLELKENEEDKNYAIRQGCIIS